MTRADTQLRKSQSIFGVIFIVPHPMIDMEIDVIKFRRPEKHNALDLEHMREISKEFHKCRNPVVITGEPSFCSGLDLDYISKASEREIAEFAEVANSFILEIARYPRPVIAFVQGYAIGGGFSIALACDGIVADINAIFSTGFARLGIAPDMGVSYFLPRTVGVKKALKLLSTAERFKADEALDMDIVARIGEIDDAFDLARKMEGNSLKYIKELIYPDIEKHVMMDKELALKSISEIRIGTE